MDPPVALFRAAGRGIGAAAAGKLGGKCWAVAILSSSGRGAALASGQSSHVTSRYIRSHGGLIRSV